MVKKYTPEEREEAVKLANEVGASTAAERLDINVDTLYGWISKDRQRKNEAKPKLSQSELEKENERLKKELAEKEKEVEILQDALGFFASSRRKSQKRSG